MLNFDDLLTNFVEDRGRGITEDIDGTSPLCHGLPQLVAGWL